ncbi:MAG TPA: endonuclease/exonuclease/phosphatase family protein [Stellaceae bacterium]|nr:endonuclease/exonuclease/phosphatase family protein [Stellaceae bacterium]
MASWPAVETPSIGTKPPRLVVASYNIHSGVGVDRRYEPARIIAVLKELDADIVGLQEVDARHRRHFTLDQWSYFAEATGLQAIPGPNISDHRGRFGNAILTRLPIRSFRHIDLSVADYEPRGAIEAVLCAGKRDLRVVVTHLGLHAGERRQQITRLLEALDHHAGAPEAMIVIGDLNEWRGRRGGIEMLERRLGRAPAPRSFPAFMPILPLDRVYAGGGLALRGLRVHRSTLARVASDHLPLRAVIGWV